MLSRKRAVPATIADERNRPISACGDPDCEAGGIAVNVVFTRMPETVFAIKRATELASEIGARIRVLIPCVVPYPLSVSTPDVDTATIVSGLKNILPPGVMEVRIDVLLCRDRPNAVLQSLTPSSLVLLAARKRWWPTEHTSLISKLRAAGHDALFLAADRQRPKCVRGRRLREKIVRLRSRKFIELGQDPGHR